MTVTPRKRPEVLKGETSFKVTGCGKLYITINVDEEGNVFELFTSMGKAGGCAASQAEAIGRLVSLALRSRIAPEAIVKHLKGIRCHEAREGICFSCADAIGGVLKKTLALEGEPEEVAEAPVGDFEIEEVNADTGS